MRTALNFSLSIAYYDWWFFIVTNNHTLIPILYILFYGYSYNIDIYLLQCIAPRCLYYTYKFCSFADFIAWSAKLTRRIHFFFSLLSPTALPRNSVVKPTTTPSPLTDRKELGHRSGSPAKPCNHLLYTYIHYMYTLYNVRVHTTRS